MLEWIVLLGFSNWSSSARDIGVWGGVFVKL